jgi:aminopeptidase YwaD
VLAEEIGSRPAGSAGEEQAARYIAGQFASYGYETEVVEFQGDIYVEESSTLEVTAPESLPLSPRSLSFSRAGEVTAELAAAGIGRPEDFPSGGLDGRIALLERGELSFAEKVENAADSGAGAVIIYNNEEGPFRGDLPAESAIPAVAVSKAEGEQLLSLLKKGPVTIYLSVEGGYETLSSQNVIGRAVGEECRFVVGGHYDSVAAGPGANDNASGVATLLEIARVLVVRGDEGGICFAAFGAEEVGLLGSSDFVDSLTPDEQSSLQAMVNLDMVGVGDEWQLVGSPDLVDGIDAAAAVLSLDPVPTQVGDHVFSDQQSFIGAGIPAVLIHRFDDPNYHTEADKAEFVEPTLLREAADLALLALGLEPSR